MKTDIWHLLPDSGRGLNPCLIVKVLSKRTEERIEKRIEIEINRSPWKSSKDDLSSLGGGLNLRRTVATSAK
ncbi:hypothetical protein, partial [Microcoleus anatoxicus]|uniref:hypothetical protein n=1 Tax=Microcoleus anatoxicus TaxID=2705319 RepID=UPI0030C8EF99